MPAPYNHHPSSYRDPSGYIFYKDEILYRQVNTVFKDHFDYFIQSGCCYKLQEKGLLIHHEIINENLTGDSEWYLTLKPVPVDFISYSYEWPFDMLKDAALLTLQLVKEAISYGMILKDASPSNIQWQNGKLIFIDTLSFERYDDKKTWIAYRQFCENFLSPLLIMHYSKQPLHELLLAYPNGVPLSITKSLLPRSSKFSLHTYLHIHLNAAITEGKKKPQKKDLGFSKNKLLNLVRSLELLIIKLKTPDAASTWGNYYNEASGRDGYLEKKKEIIQQWINELPSVKIAADLGANDGEFSKILASKNIGVISTDADANCINRLYNEIKTTGEKNIQPLIIDLSNPSPATGVNNNERASFIDRTNTNLVLALALIHHLAIGKNIPFEKIAEFFSSLGKTLIVEFVPMEDEKVQLMLSERENVFNQYNQEHFEKSFQGFFSIIKQEKIPGSERILYMMTKK